MKNVCLSLSILLFSSQLYALVSDHSANKELCTSQRPIDVNTLSEVFSKGVVEGEIRAANIDYNYAVAPSAFATSVGGQLKYETGKLYNTSTNCILMHLMSDITECSFERTIISKQIDGIRNYCQRCTGFISIYIDILFLRRYNGTNM